MGLDQKSGQDLGGEEVVTCRISALLRKEVKKMKTLVAILMGVALVAICLPASAEVLSDSQLGEIYAGAVEIAQSNIGAIVAFKGGEVKSSDISNSNTAYVTNRRGLKSTIAQSNIGAIVAFKGGEVKSSYISNSNYANVNNY